MNFKRKNKTNRSLRKKNDINSDYAVPKTARMISKDRKNNKDIKTAMEAN